MRVATPLRQFLFSLCHSSCWNYAVFWKLQNHSKMILAWEDGYCDCSELMAPENVQDNIFIKATEEVFYSNCKSSLNDGSASENPVWVAMDDVSRVQSALREGVLHEVAYTGKHCWIFCNNFFSEDPNSKLASESPDKWLLKILASIKTVLVVPVVPHGVLQLGSLEKVAEDLEIVAYIKDRFNTYQNFVGYSAPFSSNNEFEAMQPMPSSLSSMSISLEKLDEPSRIIMKDTNSKDSMAIDKVKPKSRKIPKSDPVTPWCTVHEAGHISGNDMWEIIDSARENETSVQSMGLFEVSKPSNKSINPNRSEMMESNVFPYFGVNEELEVFSCSNNFDLRARRGTAHEVADNTGHKNMCSFISFPIESEPRKALGSAFLGWKKESLWDSYISVEDVHCSSIPTCSTDHILGIAPSGWGSNEQFSGGGDAEHLLGAECNYSDDGASCISNNTKSSMTSLGQFAATKVKSQSDGSALVGEGAILASVARGRSSISNFSPSSSSRESKMSSLIEEQQREGYNYLHPWNGSKLLPLSKRRDRTSANWRQKSTDRQLIQDRLKQLRGLVPDGARCSIEDLLDQTIKHMLFLRKVTDQADNLKHWVHQKVTGQNVKSSETKGGRWSGKSWAVELGTELQVRPIVVEDLECPGHLLIEMLCNDFGLFLEIAEVIRGLKLTILKGVMEEHSNRTWAHFIIQASNDFHRMNIFWPLMQLLKRSQCAPSRIV